jgi:hypothetical protein
MIVGSFGPWARALFVTVSGVDGDGWFVILAAIGALAALYVGASRPQRRLAAIGACVVAGAAALGVVIYDAQDIFGDQGISEDDLFGSADLVSPGWGIWMAGLASASLVLAGITLFVRGWQRDPLAAAALAGNQTDEPAA